MKERPILFSAPMVRAILDGRKTQTRRIVKPQPDQEHHWIGLEQHCVETMLLTGEEKMIFRHQHVLQGVNYEEPEYFLCPYGKPGDRLWVRENWQAFSPDENWRTLDECKIIYQATDEHPGYDAADYAEHHELSPNSPIWDQDIVYPWRPSIHLPRRFCRILLDVKNIRVERLQDISIEDAKAEGIPEYYQDALNIFGKEMLVGREFHVWDNHTTVENFSWLWGKINGDKSWDENPWVWVPEFERGQ